MLACGMDSTIPRARADAPAADDITGLTALALSAAIRARRLGCAEVMAAYLDRIERLNPAANAIVSLRPRDALMAEARAADAEIAAGRWRGWMHGMPQAPKDLAETAGLATTRGSPILKDHVPDFDAIVVERARAAGAILIGKTNVPEFGLGSHTYNPLFGPTPNVFDPSRSAGGSSGGAAVALALDLLPVADGSDMMGSLRNPAGWNGVFGLRPSFGRVPNGPAAEAFVQQLGVEGPMGRNVADLAMLLSTQAGFDSRAPLSLAGDGGEFAGRLDRDWTGARIGWLGDAGGYLAMEPGIVATCAAALGRFEAIGCVVEAAAPDFPLEALWEAWVTLRGMLVGGALGAVFDDPARRALLKPEAVWEVENARTLSAAAIYRASEIRTGWSRAMARLFEQFDFLVSPSAQLFPFPLDLPWPREIGGRRMDTYHRWMEVMIPATMAGLPALAVPAGFGPGGLPIGLQIIGPQRADLAVLQVGHAYERAMGGARSGAA